MTDPANPHGYVGGWVLYATLCGHPIAYRDTEFDCQLIWHDFDHGPMTGPSVDTATHSDTRLATQADLDALRRDDACELCSLDTTPITGPPVAPQLVNVANGVTGKKK